MEGYFGYRIILLGLILAINGFFAASEVALVSVRPSRLKSLAEEGNRGAHAALLLLSNPEKMLSVVQVGVTLASLGLGWAGEDTVYSLLLVVAGPLITPATSVAFHWAALIIGFALISYLHVVVGEVVPKNVAIDKADRLATIVAPMLLFFERVSSPFVFVVAKSAGALSRVLGVRRDEHGYGHSAEEVKFILRSIRSAGGLRRFEEDAIEHLLEMHSYVVREAMVPRNNIVSVPVTASLDEVLLAMNESRYSRLPVYNGTPENITGILFAKDLLKLWDERRLSNRGRKQVRPFHLRNFVRKPMVVPETKPLDQLVDEFRQNHQHMAVVVDEWGTIVGLITMEDVLEQIFGEIEDEYDDRRVPPLLEAPVLELDGSTNILDLETQYDIEVPSGAGFETLAGFLLYRLGRIPKPGDFVEHGARRFTVLEMDRKRIAKVKVERVGTSEEVEE